jgi:peptidoglycan/LPS O-acetylase OafA/YrhL
MSRSRLKYRPDIDGVRALAIVPVVAYHAFPEIMPGGFVGVDVFFVISGYLISLIIFERLADGTFTFSEFYARRVRRIFPALALVLVSSLAWGWFRLFSDDYALLGRHVAGGAGFAANLVLWGEAGYFDRASEAKPLLHLWSLGIEEQFYLLWPPLLYVAWTRRLHTAAILALVFVASFVIGAIQVRTDEIAAFYSPLTRMWELVMGAALAYVTLAPTHTPFANPWTDRVWRRFNARARNVAAFVGVGCIVAAVLSFDADTSFPGWRAALPAGGALLLVAAGSDAWLNRRVLARQGLIWIGLISYPLYLWHWPLLSFATLSGREPSIGARLGLIAASVLLAWGTYALVERPIRFRLTGRTPVLVLCALMTMAGIFGYATYASEGFIERPLNRSDKAHFLQYYERLHKGGLREAYRVECDFMDWETERTRDAIAADCTRAGNRGTLFLWGDSHAQALSLGIRKVLPEGMRLAQVATSGCAPRLSEPDPLAAGGRCARANRYAREHIAALKPHVVVLAQIVGHEATDWIALARALKALGAKRVMMVGPAPQWSPTLPLVVTTHHWGQNYDRVAQGLNRALFETDRVLSAQLAESDEPEYVSLLDSLCRADGCIAVVPRSAKQLIAVDSGHLSPAGSIFVAETILGPRLFATDVSRRVPYNH